MQRTEDIYFEEAAFPLKMVEERASVIVDVSSASQALHEALEIKYFYEGRSTLFIGNKIINAEAGDIIVINPYEIHATVDYAGESGGKYSLFMIGLDFFSGFSAIGFDLRHILLSDQKSFKTQIKNNTRMQELLTNICTEHNDDLPASKLAITGYLAEFFTLLVREGMEESPISNNGLYRYYKAIEPAIRMIRDNYQSKFTVDALAGACNISKYHFCRIFKTVTGISTVQYINNYRLKIADAMIMNTSLPLSEIASACGFDDESYFCKIYKQHFGKTPLGKIQK